MLGKRDLKWAALVSAEGKWQSYSDSLFVDPDLVWASSCPSLGSGLIQEGHQQSPIAKHLTKLGKWSGGLCLSGQRSGEPMFHILGLSPLVQLEQWARPLLSSCAALPARSVW